MINGVQIIVHYPMFNLELDGDFIAGLDLLLKLATFDFPWIDMETLSGGKFTLGDDDLVGVHP